MRLGILSDVHANFEALEVVVKALEEEQVDKIICLGDTVGYGASPNECCDIVRSLAHHTVLGNHDAAVCGRMDYSFYYQAARHVLDAHAHALEKNNLTWLRSLPYIDFLDDLAFCHGSPFRLEEFDYIFAVEQAAELLPVYDTLKRVTFLGHSHLCKAFALSTEGVDEVVAKRFVLRRDYKYVISVGSVGQPRDLDNRAAFGIFDTERMIFEYRRVEYNIELAAQKIFQSDLGVNFGKRLFLGM